MFSVGMAVYDDYSGAWSTAYDLLVNHGEYINEVIFVDNNPMGKEGPALRKLATKNPKLRYEAFASSTGTAAPRNRIFEVATSEFVLVVDCHIIPFPGALKALAEFYDEHPEYQNDLIHGPLAYDDLNTYATHFSDRWEDGMWGQWAYDPRAETEPFFRIKAMGLGLFACGRDGWLGFNPAFRGFGGEEHYIHEKFRQAGRNVWCLSDLRWVHRFGKAGRGVAPIRDVDKCRNYLIGHKELNLDPRPVFEHFATPHPVQDKSGATKMVTRVSELEWRKIVDEVHGPDSDLAQLAPPSCGCPSGAEAVKPSGLLTINVPRTADDLYKVLVAVHAGPHQRAVVLNTELYKEFGPNKQGPGLMPALRRFMKEHPEWRVVSHLKVKTGETTISRDPTEAPELPSTASMGLSYLRSKVERWVRGGKMLPLPMAEERLRECWVCPDRTPTIQCSHCGCYLIEVDPDGKNKLVPPRERGTPGRVFYPEKSCPLGKWHAKTQADIAAFEEANK